MIRSDLLPELVLLWNQGHTSSEIARLFNAKYATKYSFNSINQAIAGIREKELFFVVPHCKRGGRRVMVSSGQRRLKPPDSIFRRKAR